LNGFLTIVGMGPGADSYLTLGAMAEIASGDLVVFRTTNHPSAASVLDSLAQSASPVFSFDLLYDRFDDFDTIYETMAKLIEGLVRQRVSIEDFAQSATLIHGKLELDELNKVVFVVPGSPNVAEASVRHLCEIFKDSIQVEAGVSFLDIAFSRLNRDPF
ncbi:tetrapyrrole methylase family protein/MazG family protein, partial [mine drainage metagenome]